MKELEEKIRVLLNAWDSLTTYASDYEPEKYLKELEGFLNEVEYEVNLMKKEVLTKNGDRRQ